MAPLPAKIAQQAAEYYAKTGGYMATPWPAPMDLMRQKACYVSLLEQPGSRLRASFGSPLPQTPSLAQEIIRNTVEAIVRADLYIRPIDVASYVYSVAVLGPLERITDRQHLLPNQYGLYVRSDSGASSIVLPRRIGIETADDQIATAVREAGIDTRHQTFTMYRFFVTFYES